MGRPRRPRARRWVCRLGLGQFRIPPCQPALCRPALRVGLRCVGLRCVGLRCVGLRCVGLRCVGLRCVGLRCVGLRCVGLRCVGLRCVGAALGFQLRLERSGQPGHLDRQRVERGRRVGHRRLHGAGQHGQQHLARFEVGETFDLRRAHRLAVDHSALDDQGRVDLGEVAQSLGGLDHVAPDEGDRRGSAQQPFQLRCDACFGRRELGQGVLDHAERRLLAERMAQLGQLGHGQAPVLGQHGAAGALEPLGQLGNRGHLLRPRHGPPFLGWRHLGCTSRVRRRRGPGKTKRPGAWHQGVDAATPQKGNGSSARTPARAARNVRALRPPRARHAATTDGLWLWLVYPLPHAPAPVPTAVTRHRWDLGRGRRGG